MELIEQQIATASGADVPLCTEHIKKITKEMNAKGYKLTFVAPLSKDNNPALFTEAILVYTKD